MALALYPGVTPAHGYRAKIDHATLHNTHIPAPLTNLPRDSLTSLPTTTKEAQQAPATTTQVVVHFIVQVVIQLNQFSSEWSTDLPLMTATQTRHS